MPSAAPAVLLRSPPRFTTLGDVAAQMTRRDVGMLCNFTLRLRHGREIAQPYRFWGLLGFPPRSVGFFFDGVHGSEDNDLHFVFILDSAFASIRLGMVPNLFIRV